MNSDNGPTTPSPTHDRTEENAQNDKPETLHDRGKESRNEVGRFFREFRRRKERHEPKVVSNTNAEQDLIEVLPGPRNSNISGEGRSSKRRWESKFRKTQRDDEAPYSGEPEERNYRPFGSEVNIEIIQSWRRDCCRFHGNCCNDRYSETLSKHIDELHLVDVRSGCLVTMPSTTPYVALSYVWGRVPMLKTTSANLDDLRREGALFEQNAGFRVADTVRDAMYLVKRLGERYLWVDCLCIVQDTDVRDLNKMLRAMGHIYASAEFTIAAASGNDANHGLRGVGGPSKLRDTDLNYVPWHLLRCHGYSSISPWVQRGWTFQESLFSRRLLVFDVAVSWLCGMVVQHECFEDMSPDSNSTTTENTVWPAERPHLGVPMGMKSLIPQHPSLGRWGMLVQDYSSRSLTFEHDAIRAFAGATEVMSSTFPGGILHGLPIFFFDIALLWQPESEVERRAEQPSWSWTGWKGSVDCWHQWYIHYASIYRRTGKFTDWMAMAPLRSIATYQSTTSTGVLEPPTKDFNGFYRYQALRGQTNATLPPGWQRHEHSDGPYYTTKTTKRGNFRFGFPLPSAEPSQTTHPADISPILLCTAPFVTASFSARPTISAGGRFAVSVRNAHATATLSLQERHLVDIKEGTECLMIAVSEAEVVDPKRLGDWLLSRPIDGGSAGTSSSIFHSEAFLNVLWIELQGDIAYRKALGFVGKKEWDALHAEVVTIKLG